MNGIDIDPRQPTNYPAGSPEKIAVLVARHAARLPLWHPADSTRLVDPPDRPDAWQRLAEATRRRILEKRRRTRKAAAVAAWVAEIKAQVEKGFAGHTITPTQEKEPPPAEKGDRVESLAERARLGLPLFPERNGKH